MAEKKTEKDTGGPPPPILLDSYAYRSTAEGGEKVRNHAQGKRCQSLHPVRKGDEVAYLQCRGERYGENILCGTCLRNIGAHEVKG